MAAVMIGVDPHEGSHTAVVIDQAEMVLAGVQVRASAAQVQRLLAWAAAWPERTWAVEGAGGLGHLLARQLAAAGERVLDVQPEVRAKRYRDLSRSGNQVMCRLHAVLCELVPGGVSKSIYAAAARLMERIQPCNLPQSS
jgi:hypothetical protein